MYPNDEWYDLGDLIDFGEKHLWEMLVTEGLHEDAGHLADQRMTWYIGKTESQKDSGWKS